MQLRKLEDVLYAMPETPGAVPMAFTEMEPADQDDGVEEMMERPNKRQCPDKCVDIL